MINLELLTLIIKKMLRLESKRLPLISFLNAKLELQFSSELGRLVHMGIA